MILHLIADLPPGMWHDILIPDISIAEKMVRPLIVYVFLVVGLRIAGKRELAQLNPFDLIVLLTLSNTVQNAIIGNDNSVSGGLIGAATLLAINYAVVRLVHRSKRLQNLVEGRRDILIKDGRLRSDHLERELITQGDLRAAALKQGITSLKDVEDCILEPTGSLIFVEKKPTHGMLQHTEIMAVLEEMRKELAALRSANAAATQPAAGPAEH
jgi:uncharacterized membrane protein YcaP (DUF421 family)